MPRRASSATINPAMASSPAMTVTSATKAKMPK
jgi:hypothetical protein